jgi:hypothetical protein
MSAQILISGSEGPVEGTLLGETMVDNKPFAIVNLGIGAFIRGVYTKFGVIPTHLILNREINDVREKD